MMKGLKTAHLIILTILLVSFACRKEQFNTSSGAALKFSTDTVTFDTIFTTIGSATLNFKVYNPYSKSIKISTIRLAGGGNSFFRLNIDGEPTRELHDVEVPPKDSLFIFIAVTVDPTNENNPIVIKDSVEFITNGNYQDVKLIAYGQDVHLINGQIIGTQTWLNDKPYLIYNSMAVDTGETLTISEGARIYVHRNSSIIVWGKMIVNGTLENPVLFQNDRLENLYKIVAGQWGTIYFDPISTGNEMNYAIIKNSVAGIQIGYPADYHVPSVVLKNCIIQNESFAGIYAFGADITCYNSVIADCAGAALALLRGGNYTFRQCTISNSGVIGSSRTSPSVVLTNIFYNPVDNGSGQYVYVPVTGDLTEASFENCIIYGILNHELQFVNNKVNSFNYLFNHCLVKAVKDSIDINDTGHYLNLIFNKDPRFLNDSDRYHLDFHLDTLSPAKDAGDPAIIAAFPYLQYDYDGMLRTSDSAPDLGAFERKEE